MRETNAVSISLPVKRSKRVCDQRDRHEESEKYIGNSHSNFMIFMCFMVNHQAQGRFLAFAAWL
jgi:hypothetical protein